MSQNLSSAAVVIGPLRVEKLKKNGDFGYHSYLVLVHMVTKTHFLVVQFSLCMLGNFLPSADFFKVNFFEKFFQDDHQSVKQFGSRSGPTF